MPIMKRHEQVQRMPGRVPSTRRTPRHDRLFGNVSIDGDVFGFTASGYAELADAVFSTESRTQRICVPDLARANSFASQVVAPASTASSARRAAWLLRMDKNIAATQACRSEKPMYFSVQLFDKWVLTTPHDRLLNRSAGAPDEGALLL